MRTRMRSAMVATVLMGVLGCHEGTDPEGFQLLDDAQAFLSVQELRDTPDAYFSSFPETATLAIDPGATGPFAVERHVFEDRIEVVRPVGAMGPHPVVVFAHGNTTDLCELTTGPVFDFGGDDGEFYPCPAGYDPVRSYQGFRYLTDVLSSQGFITLSMDLNLANAVSNAERGPEDGGAAVRAGAIDAALTTLADWTTTPNDPFGGVLYQQVDLDEVMLVGHSRGGEGAMRLAIENGPASPYTVRAVTTIGGTYDTHQVRPDLHLLAMVGHCEGDVADNRSVRMIDESRDLADSPAFRTTVMAIGANHSFFNTVWTGDDAANAAVGTTCHPTDQLRLTADEQRDVALAYVASFAQFALQGQTAVTPLLDGTVVKPTSIGRAETSVTHLGGDSLVIYRPEVQPAPVGVRGMQAQPCVGFEEAPRTDLSEPMPVCGWSKSPHEGRQLGKAVDALELTWPAGSASGVVLDVGEVDLSAYTYLDLRIANDPAELGPRFFALLTDAEGRSAASTLLSGGRSSIEAIPIRTMAKNWRLVPRFDSAQPGFDSTRVAQIELLDVRGNGGHAFLFDVTAKTDAVLPVVDLDLPRATVELVADRTVTPATYDAVITTDRPVVEEAAVWLSTGRELLPVTLPVGSTTTTVPVGTSDDYLLLPALRLTGKSGAIVRF